MQCPPAQSMRECPPGVHVRTIGPPKGRGVFATQAFAVGDVVFQDEPLLMAQHGPNMAQVRAGESKQRGCTA